MLCYGFLYTMLQYCHPKVLSSMDIKENMKVTSINSICVDPYTWLCSTHIYISFIRLFPNIRLSIVIIVKKKMSNRFLCLMIQNGVVECHLILAVSPCMSHPGKAITKLWWHLLKVTLPSITPQFPSSNPHIPHKTQPSPTSDCYRRRKEVYLFVSLSLPISLDHSLSFPPSLSKLDAGQICLAAPVMLQSDAWPIYVSLHSPYCFKEPGQGMWCWMGTSGLVASLAPESKPLVCCRWTHHNNEGSRLPYYFTNHTIPSCLFCLTTDPYWEEGSKGSILLSSLTVMEPRQSLLTYISWLYSEW